MLRILISSFLFPGVLPFSEDAVREILQKHAVDARMRSYEVEGENWEIIYELRLSDLSSQGADALVQALKTLSGVRNVSLLAPQLSLPI